MSQKKLFDIYSLRVGVLECADTKPAADRAAGLVWKPETDRDLSVAYTDRRLIALWLHGKSEATRGRANRRVANVPISDKEVA
jgi:hypothetical protein